jgi:nucleotide-binding universal stress UspA family protein
MYSAAKWVAGRKDMYQTLLVPLDGSAAAERALPYAEALARTVDARIILLRAVVGPAFPAAMVESLEDALRQAAQALVPPPTVRDEGAEEQVDMPHPALAYLNGIASRLRERGCIAEPELAFGDPARVIVDAIRARAADLVVMATHGRSSLGQLATGSVARAVLRSSIVPVFLVRAGSAPLDKPRLGGRARLLVPLDGSGLAECALDVAANLASQLGAELELLSVVPEGDAATTEVARRYLATVADRLVGKHLVGRPGLMVRAGDPATAIAEVAAEMALVVMATHGRSGLGRLVNGSVAEGVPR